MNCPICSSTNSKRISVRGYENLWSKDLSHESLFNFLHCQDCGFCWNNDYGKLIFSPESYDNYTPVSDASQAEKLLAQKVSSLIPSLELSARSSLNFIEVGSGKRLGMLRELLSLHQDASFFAVDPILTNQSLSIEPQKCIFLIKDLFDIELPPESFNIFVFRNSLEYISPTMLRQIFNTFLGCGGLVITELSSINMNRQGVCHVFSECLNFYMPSHILSILNDCRLKSLPLETSILHGPDRILSILRVFSFQEAGNTLLFNSIRDLVDCLDEHLSFPEFNAIMFGAGGRNIMALLNHFHDRIHGVYDSDPQRRSSILPRSWQFIDHGAIPGSWGIILLNSSFLSSARQLFPDNLIFILSSQ